jgi:2-hydroxy-3-keto-5-methylthiopentenyl-1-phosphate phosphatase
VLKLFFGRKNRDIIMNQIIEKYKALISSDWNQCLAPSGPFDAIYFNYPKLRDPLQAIFRQYTGNRIALKTAVQRIEKLLPKALTIEEMDGYLTQKFTTYRNVAALMQWCRDHDILFMINTTGMIGFFQRVFRLKLLPIVPVLCAHPMLRFAPHADDPKRIFELYEISDKARATQKVMEHFQIPPEKTILMGDSGGDGPHFLWGQRIGAHLIGSMTKYSLTRYCEQNDIRLDSKWGVSYQKDDPISLDSELKIDFLDLIPMLKDWTKIA